VAEETAEQAILTEERRALDRWAEGNPLGFVAAGAEDITYFDDIAAHRRIDGLAAMRSYAESLRGKIPPHRYELVDPKVQVYGDVGILTLRYHPFESDGNAMTRWKATSVYRRTDGGWRIVHAHWSMVKEPGAGG
jgi:ketosteroid isomerase-like protein